MPPEQQSTVAAPFAPHAGAPHTSAGARAASPYAIEVRGLRKRYGRSEALKGLDLQVPAGAVYAVLGRNGAGKSTLIQLLLGLLEPDAGSIRVLQLDPVRCGVELRRRIGYIPERLPMYEWMTVKDTLRLVAEVYPRWDAAEETRLMEKFRIQPEKRIRELSRGSRALLALVMAMSYGPEVVLLDECTSGMDPVFRREFDRSVIETLHESGRTVLFASHQIRDLEKICDWVGIIDEGRMLLQMPVDDLRASVKMLRVVCGDVPAEELPIPNVLDCKRAGREWLITVRNFDPGLEKRLLAAQAQVGEVIDLDLEEIFVALLGREQEREQERAADSGKKAVSRK